MEIAKKIVPAGLWQDQQVFPEEQSPQCGCLHLLVLSDPTVLHEWIYLLQVFWFSPLLNGLYRPPVLWIL